jgi:hypothetical protein
MKTNCEWGAVGRLASGARAVLGEVSFFLASEARNLLRVVRRRVVSCVVTAAVRVASGLRSRGGASLGST